MSSHILCIDDNNEFLFNLKASLKYKYQISVANHFDSAVPIMKQNQADLVFLDVDLGDDENGIKLIHKIKKIDPSVVIIMLSGHRDPELIVRAIKEGASDYLCKPYPFEDLIAVIEKNIARKNVNDRNDALIEYYNDSLETKQIIARSPRMLDVLKQSEKLKGYQANILIEGESGTGKEVLARYIHALEDSPKRPFISINCAAIPDTLIETELFGHERGAFTGAIKRKIGKFELAHGGDLFLDEINAVSPEFQAKLLRVLQEMEFYRVGGMQPIKVNVRVIVATNKDLHREVVNKNFREDLFYRLRVIHLKIPALRQRPEDISPLVDYFIKKYAREEKRIVPKVYDKLMSYDWPGNIRELENLIQSLVIMTPGTMIEAENVPKWFWSRRDLMSNTFSDTGLSYEQINMTLKQYLRTKEKEFIDFMLQNNRGNISKTANLLGVSRNTLYNRMEAVEENEKP